MTLEIVKLSKRIENKWVLRDVSFSVDKGEIFGILASDEENPKEILRCLSGVAKPTSGSISYDGVRIGNGRKHGFFYLGDETTSRWRRLFSSSHSNGRAKTHARLVENSFAALKNVFLVENPVQILAPDSTKRIIREIKETTTKKQLCTVIVTNDPLEVFQLCDRIGILYKGEIIESGTPKNVYCNPNRLETARLFGNNNLISARRLTSSKKATPEFVTIDGNHNLKTDYVDKARLGPINQNITLSIRPEHISMSFGASFPEDNLLKAEVVEIEFHGATTSITLNANGLLLEVVVLRAVGLEIGKECMIGLPPARIRVLKE